ncbi:MAG: penicillin-binding protein 1B [Gammaproteobacteria bacterium]|nr:penicillin-binding protein 1B [Gammaproteobacteria bacterium]
MLVLAGAALWLDHVVRRDFSRLHWSQPARVYARPLELHSERGIGADELVEVLRILGYRQEANAAVTGSFAKSANVVTVRTRGFQSWDGSEPPRAVQIRFAGNAISELTEPETGAPVPRVRLEPIEIAQFDAIDRQDRIVVAIADVPQDLINALLAVEDHDFYDHVGIDPVAVLRAMLANLLAREVVQGGSTLTQQLVKNLYLSAERSLWRKLREAFIALIIELHFTKQEILQAYLNEVYLGQQGNRAVHGFGLAAQHYLGKRIQDLSLDETCLLAGLARGASYYNPFRHPERARQRRNFVLQRMRSEGFIDATTEQVAAQRDLGLVERPAASAGAYSDFMDLVRLQLEEHFPAAVLRTQGLRIMTSLDYLTQRQVVAAIDRTLPELGKRSPKRLGSAQAAVLVTDVRSGDILALSGGRDNAPGDFNRAVTARRPVGSLLKPAVYLAALESGRYHLASIIPDSPLTVRLEDGQAWRPQNYSGSYSGEVRILEALPESLNLPAVHLGLEVGLEAVAESIRRLGFHGAFTPYPSIILGAIELSSVEIAAMYQTLASGGLHMPLRAVQAVTSADGRMLAHYAPEAVRVISRDTAYLLEFLLRRVLQTGTARLAGERLAAMAPLAGKTGSTNDLRDSWFVGYGDDYLGVVWLGRDDNQPLGLTGASGAMPIWIDLMQRVRPRPRTFAPPPEIEWLWVDIDPFELEHCAKVMALPFRHGTGPAPEEVCAVASDPAGLKTEAGGR